MAPETIDYATSYFKYKRTNIKSTIDGITGQC